MVVLLPVELLESSEVLQMICEDFENVYYAVESWEPSVYARLAYEGFMSIAIGERFLLPEMQEKYCVLDWRSLRIGKSFKKQLRKISKAERKYTLRFDTSLSGVLQGISESHGDQNWVGEKYSATISALQEQSPFKVKGTGGVLRFHSVELYLQRSKDDPEELVAGEIGYTIGTIYTSMTGYIKRDLDKETLLDSPGKIQLLGLGKLLQSRGYSFWNLGHPPSPDSMRYKADIGGIVLSREDFLSKWRRSRDSKFEVAHAVSEGLEGVKRPRLGTSGTGPLSSSFPEVDAVALLLQQ